METDEGYRRGTVLGLTVAEVFVLLVFLILLALAGVNRYWSDKLAPWKDIMAQTNPKEVEAALAQPDELRRRLERLNSQIAELEKEKERLQNRIRTLVGEQGTSREKLEETNAKLREAELALAECEKALEDSQRKIATLMMEDPMLNDSIDELQRENDALRDKIRMIGKGITPPCWYQRIDETNPITKANWRERPYYLFDIVIRDDHMEVQPLPIPEGSAEDGGGKPYSQEAEGLGLNAVSYGIPLTNRQMLDVMTPLYEQGKASQVRTYSCIFYVRVWDETPEAAKDRWKRAHDGVLEQLFGTYQVRDIPWNDRDRVPVNVPFADRSR